MARKSCFIWIGIPLKLTLFMNFGYVWFGETEIHMDGLYNIQG